MTIQTEGQGRRVAWPRKGIGWVILVGVFAFLTPILGEVAGYAISDYTLTEATGFETGFAVVTLAVTMLLFGEDLWKNIGPALKDVFREAKAVMILTCLMAALSVYSFLGEPVAPDWFVRLLDLIVLCLGIGIFEEGVYRGLYQGGLLALFGEKGGRAVAAAVIAALFFGLAHIDLGEVVWADPMQAAQAALKICQTGSYALILGASAYRTKSLAGVALFHGLDDFLVMFVSMVLVGGDLSTEYVSEDESSAIAAIVIYVVCCLVYLPATIRAIKYFKSLPEGLDAAPAVAVAPVAPGAVPPLVPASGMPAPVTTSAPVAPSPATPPVPVAPVAPSAPAAPGTPTAPAAPRRPSGPPSPGNL